MHWTCADLSCGFQRVHSAPLITGTSFFPQLVFQKCIALQEHRHRLVLLWLPPFQFTFELDSCNILYASSAPLCISACFLQTGGRSPLTWHRRVDALIHGSANQQIKTRDYVAAGHPGHYDRDAEVRRVAVSSYIARALGFGSREVSWRCLVCFEVLSSLSVFFQECRLSQYALIFEQALLVLLPFFLKSFVRIISSPETTAAGLANLICLLWLAEMHRLTSLVFSCSWAGGAVSNRRHNGFTF